MGGAWAFENVIGIDGVGVVRRQPGMKGRRYHEPDGNQSARCPQRLLAHEFEQSRGRTGTASQAYALRPARDLCNIADGHLLPPGVLQSPAAFVVAAPSRLGIANTRVEYAVQQVNEQVHHQIDYREDQHVTLQERIVTLEDRP